uniref:VWFA domain-containing protein n=1 Tax=Cynoglossus semilaevis TaxID=244447 RepID=A0A3P8WAS9_CYNSE
MIAHNPSYALTVDGFDNTWGVHQQLMSFVKRVPRQQPRLNPPKTLDYSRRDIVFLIDGSDDSKKRFPDIKDFVQRIAAELNIASNKDHQVAVVQYSRDATVNFYLNSYSSKDDVLVSIKTMSHKFGRPLNTGKALAFVRDNVFSPTVGGRRKDLVPQYLYVFSGGRSEDDVREVGQSLKDNGIVTFTIGTKNSDTLEMQTISLIPNRNNSQFLQKADIVFLMDASDQSQANGRLVLDFIKEFVKRIEIDKVAVVQYSNDAEVSFNLDTYNTRDDIIKHIKMLRPKGGRPQYIGAALQFVKDNVFVSKAKDQHHHRKQILVVMTGGRSRDSPRGPASMLKAAGVVAFAIGSKMSNLSEMNIISSDKTTSVLCEDCSC